MWLQVRLWTCLVFLRSHEDWKFNFGFERKLTSLVTIGMESWKENASSWETCNKLTRTSNAVWWGARLIWGSVWQEKAEGKADTSLIQRDPTNPAQLFMFIIVHIFLVSYYLPAWCHQVLIFTVRKTCPCCFLNHFPREKYRAVWKWVLKFLQRHKLLNIWNAAKSLLSLSPSANYINSWRFCLLLDLAQSCLVCS